MPSQWLKNLSHKAAHVKMLQPVYGMSLGKLDAPLEFQTTPPDLFGGDAGRGRWIANGQIDINGHRIILDFDNWLVNTPYQPTPFFTKLHGFEFLLELKSLGGDVGRKTSREITQTWLSHFQNYDHLIWTPYLTALRLVNWLIAYDFAFAAAPDDFIDPFYACFYKHYHHLKNSLSSNKTIDSFDRFACLWGLIITQCHCDDFYDAVEFQSYLQLLQGTLQDITYEDGGLIDRNPENLIIFAKELLQLKQSLQIHKTTIPLWLNKHIEKTVRTLNLLTHTDKDIPLLQGATTIHAKDIDKITSISRLRPRRNDTLLKDSGYTSMRKGRTSVIIDHCNNGDHNAPIAFEIGHANSRIFVNCGTYLLDENWQKSLSHIAAHNCLHIDDEDPYQAHLNTKPSMETLNGACLFSASHEGYTKNHELTHTRRLYLDSEGEDFRGEDLLVRNIAIKPLNYTIRFHLHPSVQASILSCGTSALIRLKSGIGWIFATNNQAINLEESIYAPCGYSLQKTQQIVIRSSLDDLTCTTKWALKKQ